MLDFTTFSASLFFTFFPPWGRPCTGPNIRKISVFALWRTLRWFRLVFAAMTAVALQVVLVVGGAARADGGDKAPPVEGSLPRS